MLKAATVIGKFESIRSLVIEYLKRVSSRFTNQLGDCSFTLETKVVPTYMISHDVCKPYCITWKQTEGLWLLELIWWWSSGDTSVQLCCRRGLLMTLVVMQLCSNRYRFWTAIEYRPYSLVPFALSRLRPSALSMVWWICTDALP